MLFFDLVLLFSYRISHSYARSSFSRLQREVSLYFHFCQFVYQFCVSFGAIVSSSIHRQAEIVDAHENHVFFRYFAFFRWILWFFLHFGAPYLASVERRVEIYDSHSNSTFLRFWHWILRFLIDFSPFFNEIYACFITFLTALMNHVYTGALFFARSKKVRPFVSKCTRIPRFLMLFLPHGSTGVCFCTSFFFERLFVSTFSKRHTGTHTFYTSIVGTFFSTLHCFFPLRFHIRIPGARVSNFNVKFPRARNI